MMLVWCMLFLLLLLLRMPTLSVVIEGRLNCMIMAVRMMMWMLMRMQRMQLIMLLLKLLFLLVLTIRWSSNSGGRCLRRGRTHRLWNERTCGLDWLTAKLYLLLLLLLQLLMLMLLVMLQLALAIAMLTAAAGYRKASTCNTVSETGFRWGKFRLCPNGAPNKAAGSDGAAIGNRLSAIGKRQSDCCWCWRLCRSMYILMSIPNVCVCVIKVNTNKSVLNYIPIYIYINLQYMHTYTHTYIQT